MDNQLIVIEGGDGAGKQTQAQLALAALEKRRTTGYFDFPQYKETLAGALVGDALAGKFGSFRHMDPHFASLPYMLDRVAAKPKLQEALERSDVVCNRYVPSNLYQAAKYKTEEEQDAFIAWFEKLEYVELGLPRPAYVFYLHVPFDFLRKLMEQKSEGRDYLGGAQGAKDQHEADDEFQKTVIGLYRRMCGRRSHWITIDCVRDGQLCTREEIHANIMHFLGS
jgi:dTMP kinase